MILKLAWRNIWRHTRRTLLTVLAIAFAAAVLVFFIGLQLSSYDTSINASTSMFLGHMQIQPKGYSERPEIRKVIGDPAALKTVLSRFNEIEVFSLRALGFALLSSEQRSYGTQIVGVELDKEPRLSTLPATIVSGTYLNDPSAHQAVVGRALARNLRVEVGAELTLLGQGQDGSLAASVIKVVGIFESGAPEFDGGLVQIPLAAFQEIFGMESSAHTLVIRSRSLEQLELIQSKIRSELLSQPESFGNLAILRWDELFPGIKEAIEFDMASSWLFYFSLVIIVSFSVLNTFLMSILERTKEFGIMLALGSTPFRIATMVLYECAVLILLGLVIGILLGSLVTLYFGTVGFSVPGSEEIAKLWHIPVVIYPNIRAAALVIGPLVILITGVVATLLPLIRIWKIEPTSALRAV